MSTLASGKSLPISAIEFPHLSVTWSDDDNLVTYKDLYSSINA